jgi:hypothetical protein
VMVGRNTSLSESEETCEPRGVMVERCRSSEGGICEPSRRYGSHIISLTLDDVYRPTFLDVFRDLYSCPFASIRGSIVASIHGSRFGSAGASPYQIPPDQSWATHYGANKLTNSLLNTRRGSSWVVTSWIFALRHSSKPRINCARENRWASHAAIPRP